jgi:hypothetical protein
MFTDSKLSVPYSVKAVMKNKKIKNRKNPDDSSNKALILAFFLFTRVRFLSDCHKDVNTCGQGESPQSYSGQNRQPAQ